MNSYLRKLYAYVEPEGKFETRDRRRGCTVQLYERVHIIRRPGRTVWANFTRSRHFTWQIRLRNKAAFNGWGDSLRLVVKVAAAVREFVADV